MFQKIIIVIFCVKSFVIGDLTLPIHLGQEYDEITTESQEEIKLDDFFWTGSGDGPPEYLKNIHTGLNKGKDVIVKTETVIATVYIENENDPNSICYDCILNPKNDNNLNYTIIDRRYWLLTVLSGYFSPPEYSVLEDKLAKLYRIAFTRQQSRHLGIVNISENYTDFYRKRRQTDHVKEFLIKSEIEKNNNDDHMNQFLMAKIFNEDETENYENKNKIISAILPSSTYEENSVPMHASIREKENPLNKKFQGNNINDFHQKGNFHDRQIRVVIHNVTLIKEDDVQHWMETRYEDPNDRRSELPFANQTELIYTVFVDGKPVLANAAADDVKLLTDDEVTNILEYIPYMKAEPYLKEPQATPLVPASNNGTTNFFTNVTQNTVWIAVGSVVILLLLLLIVILLLMIRIKHQRNAEIKRLSSHQRLLSEHQRSHQEQFLENVTTTLHEKGTQNLGYEKEYSPRDKDNYNKQQLPATIENYNTQATVERPNSSETTETSDSSIYCPINKPTVDLQSMLDEKASKLFEKKHRKSHMQTQNKTDTVVIHKKKDKKIKHKQKRRYLSENKVGSIEEVKDQFSDSSMSSDSLSDALKPKYDNLSRNEAYNPNNNYNRNKILHNRVFTDKVIYDTVNENVVSPKEAINQEMLKKLKFSGIEKSSESGGSIGSFLSMASVKSFPKSVLPEPLHRVLEPITVTHYDHYEESFQRFYSKTQGNSIENTPRNEKNDVLVSAMKKSHSDSQDPGVVGPVVWEIHKKLTKEDKEKCSAYEPASSRTRFEGLLESAIQLYSNPEGASSSSTLNTQTITPRPKENRGKSAIITGNLSHISKSNPNINPRPFTADPISSLSYYSQTQPPTPNEKAWDSRVSSPLIRPLSAGPFHKPEPPVISATNKGSTSHSADKNNLTAAPLIEAIQNELKKFKQNSPFQQGE